MPHNNVAPQDLDLQAQEHPHAEALMVIPGRALCLKRPAFLPGAVTCF